MCGSTAIDRNFNKWMVKKFGSTYNALNPDIRNPASEFFQKFEAAKKGFSGPNHSRPMKIYPINMNLPKSTHYDKDNFTVVLKT